MIYIIREELAHKYSLPALEMSRKDLGIIITTMADKFWLSGNLENQIRFLDFAGIDYRVVVDHPDFANPDGVISVTDSHVIQWSVLERSIIPRFTTSEDELSESVVDESESKE